VAEGRAAAFYDAELDMRRRFGSPPFGRLVKLTVALPDRAEAEQAGREMVERLRRAARRPGSRSRSAGRHRPSWRSAVTGGGTTWCLRGDDPVGAARRSAGAPWSIDVDPETLL
jgi:primosomal protein N'